MNRPLMCAPGAGPVSRKALLFFCVFLAGGSLGAQSTPLTGNNWGMATAPVYGSSESGAYSGAELFAGPKKFGAYFSGVLPNGRMVKPAGETIQTGMNPLGIALTPDGKYLVTSNDDERNRNVPSYQSETNVGGYSLSVVE